MRTGNSGSYWWLLPPFAAGLLAAIGASATLAEDPQAPTPLLASEPVAPSIIGHGLRPEVPERTVRTRRPSQDGAVVQAGGEVEQATPANPPVPMEPDAPRSTIPAPVPVPTPAPATVVRPPLPPPAPFAPPFVSRSAFHQRLWARRLSRVQQMRQQAEQSGDTQGAERAQYLEGMVNELHQKGLFNFAQKVVGAMQEGKLNGAAAGLLGGSTGVPETDLGSPAALPETDLGEPGPLPDADLGTPAPLPTEDAPSAVEAPLQLPPAP